MSNIIHLGEVWARKAAEPSHPIARALDALALALTDHGHIWTDEEVRLYEAAIAYCGYTDSGSSA